MHVNKAKENINENLFLIATAFNIRFGVRRNNVRRYTVRETFLKSVGIKSYQDNT